MELLQWAGETYLGKLVATFVVAMLPIVELRGAIPLGVSLGLGIAPALAASLLGNLLPVPFVVIFTRRVFEWLRSRSKWLAERVDRLEARTLRHKDVIYKYKVIGLMILVAIPLPGTGAWTGAILAALLNIRLKNAFPAIAAGVLIAGILVSGLTYGFTAII